MMTSPKQSAQQPGVLALASLLFFNPAILFLLSHNLLLSIGLPLLLAACPFFLHAKPRISIYFLNFVGLVGVGLYGETVLRFGFPEYVIPNHYEQRSSYYFNNAGLHEKYNGKEFSSIFCTNNQGLRSPCYLTPEAKITSADWLFLGDSFTQAAQVEYEQMYTSLLFDHAPTHTIVNAGISGFGIAESLAYYKDKGHELNADTVILQLCSFNDFMNVGERQFEISERIAAHSALARLILQDQLYQNPEALPIGRWVEPFRDTHDENVSYNIFYSETDPKKAEDLRAIREILIDFANVVRSNDAELMVFLIPTREQVHPEKLSEVVNAFKIPISALDMARPNRLLESWCSELNIKFVDLLQPFKNATTSPFFEYDEHLNEYGHRVVAEALAPLLIDRKSKTLRLSSSFSGDRYPSFDSQGAQLSFQSMREGNMELFVQDSASGTTTRLTFNDVDDSHPALSPDGEYIAFTRDIQGTGQTDIILRHISSGEEQSLAWTLGYCGAIPQFDPTGTSLAFAAWKKGTNDSPGIVKVDLASRTLNLISPIGVECWRPTFSPNGKYLAYIERVDGFFDVILHDLSSDTRLNATNSRYDEWDPSFSPDGLELVFSAKESDNWDLFLLDLSTLAVNRLTHSKGSEWDPVFTKDGEGLVFAATFGQMEGMFWMPVHSE